MSVAEYQAQLPAFAKRSKYGNKRTVYEGITFDSKKEAARYGELVLLLRAGVIEDLKRQVRFEFDHEGKAFMNYVADFTYMEDGVFVVEDVKSVATSGNAVYKIKKRAMKVWYGIEIRET